MSKVINVIGSCSNVGKTFVMEGLIKELKKRNQRVVTIKHDVHGFDIDHEGKDTYKHRISGADTVIISSKERYAKIMEIKEEISLESILKDVIDDYDFILVEGYKKSNLRKIEVFDSKLSEKILTKKENLICIATNDLNNEYLKELYSEENIKITEKNNFIKLVDIIKKEEEFNIK